MIGPLEDAGFGVVVPDLIGFGRSDEPVDWGGLIGGRIVGQDPTRSARAVTQA